MMIHLLLAAIIPFYLGICGMAVVGLAGWLIVPKLYARRITRHRHDLIKGGRN